MNCSLHRQNRIIIMNAKANNSAYSGGGVNKECQEKCGRPEERKIDSSAK